MYLQKKIKKVCFDHYRKIERDLIFHICYLSMLKISKQELSQHQQLFCTCQQCNSRLSIQ